jgi:hypothetical protein
VLGSLERQGPVAYLNFNVLVATVRSLFCVLRRTTLLTCVCVFCIHLRRNYQTVVVSCYVLLDGYRFHILKLPSGFRRNLILGVHDTRCAVNLVLDIVCFSVNTV